MIHALFRAAALSSAAILAAVAIACTRPAPDSADPAVPTYMPDATIKDLMQAVVDPSADVVWLSVTTTASEQGLVEVVPRNDEEWTKVRHGALTLAEAANLLIMPGRHVARPGEKSETPGVELEPEEMDALIAQDRASWNERAKALHDAAMLAVKAAESHDAERVFEVGETIENACESCHKQYWYPNERIPSLPSE